MSKVIESLKKASMVTEYGHGAFGERERYYQLDIDKFARAIIDECIRVVVESDDSHPYIPSNIREHFKEK